jgi:hypothetical protein
LKLFCETVEGVENNVFNTEVCSRSLGSSPEAKWPKQ